MCLFSYKIHFTASDFNKSFNYSLLSLSAAVDIHLSVRKLYNPRQSLPQKRIARTFKLFSAIKQFMSFGNSVGYDQNFKNSIFPHSFMNRISRFSFVEISAEWKREKAYFSKKDFREEVILFFTEIWLFYTEGRKEKMLYCFS